MTHPGPHKRMGELLAKARKDHETHPWLVPGGEALRRAPVRPTPPRRCGGGNVPAYGRMDYGNKWGMHDG